MQLILGNLNNKIMRYDFLEKRRKLVGHITWVQVSTGYDSSKSQTLKTVPQPIRHFFRLSPALDIKK